MTSKCGKKKIVEQIFLPYFDVFCDLLLNRRAATWNLPVLYNKEIKKDTNQNARIINNIG